MTESLRWFWYIYNQILTDEQAMIDIVVGAVFVIFSDYISLFAVRLFIRYLGEKPMLLLPISLVVAAVIIFITSVLMLDLALIVLGRYNLLLGGLGRAFSFVVHEPKSVVMFGPALLVYSWLLLFSCGAGLLRARLENHVC
jgi:hypothetical protein